MEPPEMSLKGKLHVDILQAKGLPPCARPYCTVTVHQRDERNRKTKATAKTTVRKSKGGKKASAAREDIEWDERLLFTLSQPTSMTIAVKESDLLYNEVVAQAEISFAELDASTGSDALALEALGTLEPQGAGASAAAQGAQSWRSGETKTISLPLEPFGELRLLVTFEDQNCLFGMDLGAVCARERVSVPNVITKCCKAIEEHGLKKEGIYRVPGSKPVVDGLRKRFIDDSQAMEFSEKEVADINNIASLLKLYLRELPEPLLTTQLYDAFLQASQLSDAEDKKRAFLELLARLPTPAFNTVAFLFTHLQRIAAQSAVNKMTHTNIATCFGMCIQGANPAPIASAATDKASSSSVLMTAEILRSNTASSNEIVRYLVEETDLLTTAVARRRDESKLAGTDEAEFASTPRSKAKRSPKAIGLFQKYDLDASGKIDFEGFRAVCRDLGLHIAPSDKKEFDTIEGAAALGKISWPSFKRWWDKRGRDLETASDKQKTMHQAVKYFRYFDKEKTGFLTKENFRELHADLLKNNFEITSDADALMVELDKDADSRISFNEFTQWLLSLDL